MDPIQEAYRKAANINEANITGTKDFIDANKADLDPKSIRLLTEIGKAMITIATSLKQLKQTMFSDQYQWLVKAISKDIREF